MIRAVPFVACLCVLRPVSAGSGPGLFKYKEEHVCTVTTCRQIYSDLLLSREPIAWVKASDEPSCSVYNLVHSRDGISSDHMDVLEKYELYSDIQYSEQL